MVQIRRRALPDYRLAHLADSLVKVVVDNAHVELRRETQFIIGLVEPFSYHFLGICATAPEPLLQLLLAAEG